MKKRRGEVPPPHAPKGKEKPSEGEVKGKT
jgi:hypothetical protein